MPLPESLEMSYLEALIEQTLEHHREILLARAYHNGIQPIYLTDRQKEYLDIHQDNQFCLNVIRPVTTALRDELNVVGFETGEQENKNGIKVQAQWFWDVWNKNNMDSRQGEVHEWALRDSETFIILDWDKEKKYPGMVLHERFTDTDAQSWEGRWSDLTDWTMQNMTGTGNGVWMIYENDDPNQDAQAAVQQWNEIKYDANGKMESNLRRTIYYPDRIERFEYNGTDWIELMSPQAWLDKSGKALGIPVIHFKNQNMLPEAWDAIPPQDAVNKTWVDILGTMDLSGYPMFVLLGLYPTTDGKPPAADGSNVWSVGPAQILGNAGAKANEASIQKFEGTDPTPLMETLKDQIMFIAQITGTPASRFITTSQIAAADTLKEQERQLRKRAYNHMILFGDAWEDVMIMARRINNAFSTDQLDESVTVEVVWKNITSLDELIIEQELGVPQETIWQRMGFTQDQIANIKGTAEYRLKFEKLFWEAFNVASQSGQTIGDFARRMGIPEDEIKLLSGSDVIPPTNV